MAGNGNGRILSLKEQAGKKDAHGRLLKHNATIEEVHSVTVENAVKVHEWYCEQMPAFVANMIVDGLVAHGLIPDTRTPAPIEEAPPNG